MVQVWTAEKFLHRFFQKQQIYFYLISPPFSKNGSYLSPFTTSKKALIIWIRWYVVTNMANESGQKRHFRIFIIYIEYS